MRLQHTSMKESEHEVQFSWHAWPKAKLKINFERTMCAGPPPPPPPPHQVWTVPGYHTYQSDFCLKSSSC